MDTEMKFCAKEKSRLSRLRTRKFITVVKTELVQQIYGVCVFRYEADATIVTMRRHITSIKMGLIENNPLDFASEQIAGSTGACKHNAPRSMKRP